MKEQELRALIRESVARHLRQPQPAAASGVPSDQPHHPESPRRDHPSHQIYVNVVNTGDACVIEPGVPCTHCQYCKSHGY